MAGDLRVQIVSDLHLEWHQDRGRRLLEELRWDTGADAVILAGDIGSMGHLRGTLERAFTFLSARFPSVFFVPGNHEFYGSRAPMALEQLRKLASQHPKVTLLEPGVIGRCGDRRVVGATLWFPFGPTNQEHAHEMPDFEVIKQFLPWVYEQNAEHVAWLTEAVREGDLVVTHHLPSSRSIPLRYVADPTNVFYLCDLEPLIVERQPALWVHGHTHDSFCYTIGATTVVANPRGYPGHENPQFDAGARPTWVQDGGGCRR
ncbi:MAG: metallophosphoesterase [Anaeromyxobacteraceae bacterium]